MELSGILVKMYKEKVENIIEQYIIPDYYKMFTNKNATENEILYSSCIFGEFLEFCSMNVIFLKKMKFL